MQYVLKASEMKEYDQDTIRRIGIPSMVLMERAALGAVQALKECRDQGASSNPDSEIAGPVSGSSKVRPDRVMIVAGTGNNGGDGLAIGRLLALEGYDVTFYMEGNLKKVTPETGQQIQILENLGFSIQSKWAEQEYDIVIDALFGIGLSRDISGNYRQIVNRINDCREKGAFVLSVDIPSGISADTGRMLGCAVCADLTVTFAFPKRGHLFYPGRKYRGILKVKEIGITDRSFVLKRPGAFCYEKRDLPGILPKRRPEGNKSTFGKVLLLAGSRDMCGACILCGSGILRAGAGMVKIVTPACNRQILQQALPEAMLYTFEGEPLMEQLFESFSWADVVVAGPGLGKSDVSLSLIKQVLEKFDKPVVLDADGLNLLAEEEELKVLAAKRDRGTLVLTPHLGELARLLGTSVCDIQSQRELMIHRLTDQMACVLAAKDAVTIVAEPGKEEIYINLSGNDGMASAGSGDVLAGIIGGLLAQGMDCFEGACLGVYLHGLAGERASALKGRYGMLAGDLIDGLTVVMHQNSFPDFPKHGR